MSHGKKETREDLEAQAREIISQQGTTGLFVQLFVMLANDVRHQGTALGRVQGTLVLLVPLTIANLVYSIVA